MHLARGKEKYGSDADESNQSGSGSIAASEEGERRSQEGTAKKARQESESKVGSELAEVMREIGIGIKTNNIHKTH